jgi:hypothetical protein
VVLRTSREKVPNATLFSLFESPMDPSGSTTTAM